MPHRGISPSALAGHQVDRRVNGDLAGQARAAEAGAVVVSGAHTDPHESGAASRGQHLIADPGQTRPVRGAESARPR